jgi:hypothetical protein
MLRRVALVRTDVSEEISSTFIRVTRIGELGATLASVVPSSPILVTLIKEALSSFETSVLTRATWHNIPDDAILHNHRRENLKSYIGAYYFIEVATQITWSNQCKNTYIKLASRGPVCLGGELGF